MRVARLTGSDLAIVAKKGKKRRQGTMAQLSGKIKKIDDLATRLERIVESLPASATRKR